ncbi:MAG TPA: hypothetical protein PKL57_12000, partial [Candidatus Wallbacteria bacterium]|nr:hypothetical protein [Candidatus Wallbacteria bacterium]
MKKTSAITIALIAVGLTFLLRLGPNIAHGLEETPTMNPVVSSSTEGIKALSARLFTEVKNDADEKLWGPAINSIEWFTATFLGEPVEAIRSGLETYVLSEEALDGFIAVAAFKIDQAVQKYLVANNRHTGPAEIETGQYTAELRRAVDVAAVIKSIYSGLIDKTPGKSELVERYYRFRKRTPGIDPPMELFVLVGSIAEALLKIEGKE